MECRGCFAPFFGLGHDNAFRTRGPSTMTTLNKGLAGQFIQTFSTTKINKVGIMIQLLSETYTSVREIQQVADLGFERHRANVSRDLVLYDTM